MHRRMRRLVSTGLTLCLWAPVALACTPDYEVQPGDTLVSIAEAELGDFLRWPEIFRANPGLPGGVADPDPGQVLALPCPDRTSPAMDPVLQMVALPGNAPLTDPDWPEAGLLTELLTTALELGPDRTEYRLTWDRQATASMVREWRYDVGFPVLRPDCEVTPEAQLCHAFHFSEPVLDLAVRLFVRSDEAFVYDQDSDLHGKRLCRPAGQTTRDLDRPDRRWLSQGLIYLVQPSDLDACFQLLLDAHVDAVAVVEFEGLSAMSALALTDQVTTHPRPLSVETVHAVIPKTHLQGTTHLHRLNTSLRALRSRPEFEEIVARHLAYFWKTLEG